MQKIIHKAGTRGHANHGWLDSHHTFSFAGYYNPERKHFGKLRVLNDDIIKGGTGFGMHPHDNMEIISIPIYGALEHKDSTGNIGVISENEIQVMSAGSGLTHSEYNHSKTDDANFLQLWIFPKEKNIEPRYDQRKFHPEEKKNKIRTVVSPDEKDKSLWINQDAYISLLNLDKNKSIDYKIRKNGNGIYIFIIKGNLRIDSEEFIDRDGIGIHDTDVVNIEAIEGSKVLLIDVPMN